MTVIINEAMIKKLLLFLFITLPFFGCKSQDKDEIRIFVAWPGADYLPSYKWNVNDEKPTGVEPVLIEKILSVAGYKYKFVKNYIYNKNGDVRIDVITDNYADISIRSITINDNRKEKVNFSIPYYYDGISAMVIDNKIKSKEDFANKVVYAEKNTTAYKWAIKNLPNSKIVNYDDFNSATYPKDLLLQNKIDILLGDRTFLINTATYNSKFTVLNKKYTKEPFGIAVNKNKSDLLKKINSVITELKKTGELEKLTSEFEK
ncbi:substrate-binding periplasmic protein [Mesonia sp.]|uniref:substrate-binding periplasmic protein n=1 Tax=Mesonia sp. TaxID=1960830 RepID=UPI003F963BF9